jgi:glycosyltransferase involved in cell wall biosynthesis
MISVLLLTYNENKHIERCVNNALTFSDDIVIVDSFSTDGCLDLIKDKPNISIFTHAFINHGKQINWSLDNLNFKNEWLMVMDSDEFVTDELREEMLRRIPIENFDGYYFKRRIYFMNKWIRFGGMYPHYIMRLFKKGFGRYEEREEDHLIFKGNSSVFENFYLEDNRNNNLPSFTRKHLNTGENEMREFLGIEKVDEEAIIPTLFGSKPQRNRWLKMHIYDKFPLFVRPFAYFFYRYFLKLGFLDGRRGFIFHTLQAFWYRFYVDARIYEMKSNWENTDIIENNKLIK